MSMIARPGFTDRIFRCARNTGLTRAWGMNLGPWKVAHILERLENEAAASQGSGLINRRIRLLDPHTQDIHEFTVVLPDQSDPDKGRISCFSPLGAELLDAVPGKRIRLRWLGSEFGFLVISVEKDSLKGGD